MSGRLKQFKYSMPYFYMVTLKRSKSLDASLPPFSRLSAEGIVENPITVAFNQILRTFHVTWFCIEPIQYAVVMPDHLHLIIKLRVIEERVAVTVVVRQLIKALNAAYWQCVGGTALAVHDTDSPLEVLAAEWHDWIVKKESQLKTFIRYIRENPARAWQRSQNRQFFNCLGRVNAFGREWFAYGNVELLNYPVLYPFQCSRRWKEEGVEWQRATALAKRLGPGCVGISTFMSPCEKACGNLIFKSGGGMIMLCPEGFDERWHPTRNKERLCSEGKMLFLSLYPAMTTKPDKATLYTRCHEMGDIVCEAFAKQ